MASSNLIQHSVVGQSFGYSAVDIDDLGATEYTLVTIVVDKSSSVLQYKSEMEACIKEAVNACKLSPRSDYLLIRLIAFNTEMEEIHGFKQLSDCNLSDYDDCIKPGGMTMLYDSATDALQKTEDYGKQLCQNDFDVNAILFIITDGCDNRSSGTSNATKDALSSITKSEYLESIITVLVGVGTKNNQNLEDFLKDYKQEAGFTKYIGLSEADEKTLAKFSNFISQSVISQSQSLNTGGTSQLLNF